MRPAVLCPVDFSEASRGAIRFAAAVAQHFGSRLTVMTVDDPLLTEAAAMQASDRSVRDETRTALARFFDETVGPRPASLDVTFRVDVGEPAPCILAAMAASDAELVVMSSHGLTGFRKMFFGSTTERVLRETTVPVLVTREDGTAHSLTSVEDAARRVKRVLAPVLSPSTDDRPLIVSRAIARALGVPQLLLHVVEPLRVRHPRADGLIPGIERERRERAEAALASVAASAGAPAPETLIAYGEPSEEIVKVARDRGVGLIVMGLVGSRLGGPRIGSVTYRVLCASPCPVLALPALPARREKTRTAGKNTRGASATTGASRENRSRKR